MFKKAGDTDTRVAILKKRVLTSQIIGGGKIMMKGFRKGRQRFSHKGRIKGNWRAERKWGQLPGGISKRVVKCVGRSFKIQSSLILNRRQAWGSQERMGPTAVCYAGLIGKVFKNKRNTNQKAFLFFFRKKINNNTGSSLLDDGGLDKNLPLASRKRRLAGWLPPLLGRNLGLESLLPREGI